ncbi:MAG: LPS export ABC transporter permease LptF [Gammaproteobacteria bacterium]|nr:LPS export ABC transporter permease LptF [Gammaproteobacteria bacterium]MYJ52853.1 LPS export ABC transporter permease LptF [Gammaproteobacteria bacterium]
MIIQRAFVRETVKTSVAVTVIIIAIFAVTRLVGFLGSAADGNIAVESVFLLLFLKLISYLDIILSLSVYLSVLLVFGRWISEREMTALNTCGIGMAHFLKPGVVLFLITGTVSGAFSLYLGPLASQIGHDIEKNFRNRSDIVGITPGEFSEFRGGDGVYFIGEQDRATDVYSDIFVYSREGRDDGVVAAKTGYKNIDGKTGDDLLVLRDGARYKMSADSDSYSVTAFETYSIRLRRPPAKTWEAPVKALPTFTLLEERRPRASAEFHWRLSKVFMLGVLILLSLSFTSPSYRKGRFMSMLFAFLVYFVYSNMLGAGTALGGKGAFPPHLALWSVNLAFLLLAAWLFHRRSRYLQFLPWKSR